MRNEDFCVRERINQTGFERCLLVDSTRSGKQMPDSFAKTVPIWCCVVNRAVKLRARIETTDWDEQLYCPPQCVSRQEHAEILKKIPGWTTALAVSFYVVSLTESLTINWFMKASSYELPLFNKPLRPIWVTPSSSVLPIFQGDMPFIPIICLTASKQVENGLERRMQGFPYVQGAGDDHEGWSQASGQKLS